MLKNKITTIIACAASLTLLSSKAGSPKEELTEKVFNKPPSDKSPSDVQYTVYISFDDGPTDGSKIVNEISLTDSIPIDVFLVGKNACSSPKNRSIYQAYHDNPWVELDNHSYSHAEQHYRTYFQQPALVLADFNRNKDSLRLGTQLCRLPGRNIFRVGALERNESSNGISAADTLAAAGYKVFGWDLEWRNKASKGFVLHDGEQMLGVVTEMLQKHKTLLPGSVIILLHDQEMKDPVFRQSFIKFVERFGPTGGFSLAASVHMEPKKE